MGPGEVARLVGGECDGLRVEIGTLELDCFGMRRLWVLGGGEGDVVLSDGGTGLHTAFHHVLESCVYAHYLLTLTTYISKLGLIRKPL